MQWSLVCCNALWVSWPVKILAIFLRLLIAHCTALVAGKLLAVRALQGYCERVHSTMDESLSRMSGLSGLGCKHCWEIEIGREKLMTYQMVICIYNYIFARCEIIFNCSCYKVSLVRFFRGQAMRSHSYGFTLVITILYGISHQWLNAKDMLLHCYFTRINVHLY